MTSRALHDPNAELVPGDRIDERYVVESVIGHGTTSIVYRARSIPDGGGVALKVLRAALVRGAISATRLEREAELVARLDHPSIVRVFETGWLETGQIWIALELLEGETLEALLQREAPLGVERTVRLLDDVLAGLAVAHGAQILHRDLKPANLVVVRDERGEERGKLLDFGVGRDLRDTGPRLTAPQALVGTLAYLAPEQLTPGMDPDARADLWALAVVAYRALTGRAPFGLRGARMVATIVRHDPEPPSALVPALGARVDAFFARALAKDRDARWQDAHAMREALLALVR
ncbi:serine/threonine-protein kinase [Sandaracinus amylolyticus]|uniref:serine/threonine-protein kinase n=1 Tax=Sandaracinus amylolyticus TaxID=927083 RepID=UPI001F3248F0|nr:serine/threonine-protein kinase [Sandaracinus amylolyticus]UJR78546.1 Serine/threonine protein kinase [Sandaracinus amylolyticus]